MSYVEIYFNIYVKLFNVAVKQSMFANFCNQVINH